MPDYHAPYIEAYDRYIVFDISKRTSYGTIDNAEVRAMLSTIGATEEEARLQALAYFGVASNLLCVAHMSDIGGSYRIAAWLDNAANAVILLEYRQAQEAQAQYAQARQVWLERLQQWEEEEALAAHRRMQEEATSFFYDFLLQHNLFASVLAVLRRLEAQQGSIHVCSRHLVRRAMRDWLTTLAWDISADLTGTLLNHYDAYILACRIMAHAQDLEAQQALVSTH